MNTNENSALNEGWQAQINFQVQQTNLEELKSWINNGKLQPTHKVRIKNLTWIEAQSIPAFQKLFELKKLNKSFPPNPPQRQSLSPMPLNFASEPSVRLEN